MKSANRFFLPRLTLLLFTGAVQAASFDCAKATRPIDKLICSDAEASKLDGQMSAAYKTVQAVIPDREQLLRGQREWMRNRDACKDGPCLVKAYQTRLAKLESLKDKSVTAKTKEYKLDALGENCPPLDGAPKPESGYKECVLGSVQPLTQMDGKEWILATYCLSPSNMNEANCKTDDGKRYADTKILVFVRDQPSAPLRLEFKQTAEAGSAFNGAKVFNNSYGTFLEITIPIEGTGNFNGSAYYHYNKATWQAIDFKTWQKDLQKRLPKGLEIWKGPWPDLKAMIFDSSLWKPKDANCCPTGGTVHVKLGLKNNRLVVEKVSVKK